jgi:hypothetical protein
LGAGQVILKLKVNSLAFNSFGKAIHIPLDLRGEPIGRIAMSARLAGVLCRTNIRVLGDLHGRKVVDFARQRNCGHKTLHELDTLVRRAHSRIEQTRGPEGGSLLPGNGIRFVVPESISQLRFAELPITTRLTNVVRWIGLRKLGDLNSLSVFELFRCRNCGWRTVEEIGQLIQRAISGEFHEAPIEKSARPTELLRLLEEALAKLPVRDKQLLLGRIGGEAVPPSSLEELGLRHALTRARVHQLVRKALNVVKKARGPRIPRLLEVVKRRCLSNVCPLTPALLGQWIRESRSTFQLSLKAQVRLIRALDEDIPCWPNQHDGVGGINAVIRRLDVNLAKLVGYSNGCLTVADAYGKLRFQGQYRRLKVGEFLVMLRRVRGTVVEFDDPQSPVIRRPRKTNDMDCKTQARRTNEREATASTLSEFGDLDTTPNDLHEYKKAADYLLGNLSVSPVNQRSKFPANDLVAPS